MKTVSPLVVAKRVDTKFRLSGYFAPQHEQLFCLFQHRGSGDIITSQVSFLEDNVTTIDCETKLTLEGVWIVGLKYRQDGSDMFENSHNLAVIVYDELKGTFPAH